MTITPPPQGTEPVDELQQVTIQGPPSPRYPGIVMRLRGRTIRIRRLRKAPTGLLFWLSILGPGLVAGAVGNDAGGIAAYSQAGAQFGYDFLWLMLLITISLAVVQEMTARLGAATGRGLLGLIRTRFGIGWTLLASMAVLTANFGLVLGEFVGISSAMELLGVNRLISVPLAALLVSYLVVAGNYNRVEKFFMVMAAAFLTYLAAALLAHPNPVEVLHGAFVPTIHLQPGYFALLIGLVGTTISPYQQVFQQSAVIEKGISRRRYTPERWDTYAGAVFSNVISIFIIIATAATLHKAGVTTVNTAADAAKALQPAAGPIAGELFAIGLLGASLMAAAVIAISTAFALTEAFGLPQGISLEPRRAPIFYGLFLAQVVLAAILALIPGIPAFQLLIGVQVLNGALFPVLLVFILLLSNDARLMGDLRNTRATNLLGWITLALVAVALAVGLLQAILMRFGIRFLGS